MEELTNANFIKRLQKVKKLSSEQELPPLSQ